MRKLASIQEIQKIEPIPGKDCIELAHVQGWTVVVQKGEYKPGDLTVYVEIDSVLPERPEFEFLRPKHFRIKTMKLNGVREDGTKVPVYSQGICFPLSILPGDTTGLGKKLLVGTDVTEFLGIKKYDEYGDENADVSAQDRATSSLKTFLFKHKLTRPLAKLLFKRKRGTPQEFLTHIVPKTDETRIQALPHLLEDKHTKYVGREKVDGQSGTFILRRVKEGGWFTKPKCEFIVCSRNRRLTEEDDSSFWTVARKYDIENVLRGMINKYEWVCIQGEVVGPKIQGNKYKLSEVDFYVFNMIIPTGKIPCNIAEPYLGERGLKWCPLVVEEYTMPDTVDEVLSFATGKSALCDTLREGVVFRNYLDDISFKAVSPDFLIKNGL